MSISGDPFFDSCSLILNGQGANNSTTFVDQSVFKAAPTVGGNAKISTAQFNAGVSSMSFDGTGGTELTYANAPKFQLTGNFTVEAWVYFNSTTGDQTFLSTYNAAGGGDWYFDRIGGSVRFQALKSTGVNAMLVNGSSGGIVSGSWFHVAACFNGTVLDVSVNGTSVGTVTPSGAVGATANPCIVGYGPDGGQFNGYMRCRVTKAARYVTPFTPSSALFPGAIPSFAPTRTYIRR